MKGAPESLRHVEQWQLVKYSGSVVLVYFTFPHRQEPVSAGDSSLVDTVLVVLVDLREALSRESEDLMSFFNGQFILMLK
jgi:hypothetical protein